jgi:hypothetical protein
MPDDFSLRDLGEPPEASYEAVRRRVMGEIRRRKRVRNAMRIVAVAAGVVLVMAGLLALRPGPPMPRAPMLARAPGAPVLTPVNRLLARAARKGISPSRDRRERYAPAQELVVRMQTDDPNVVIIWMVD